MTTDSPKYRRFGSYVLLQLSGAGGMGRVDVALSARARGTERLCVVKRMHAQLRTEEQVARFRREAGIAIGLSHGAIAQTLDVEEIDGELCILQEYIHGTNLSQLEHRAASREPLPIPLSVHVVSEVARALAYAHSLPGTGIVHRDVTPDNIMLSFTGEVKLIDFGIAKVMGDTSLTQVRMVVGRPIYTAPEVARGGEADHRSDIYSLGVVLWQLLTGGSYPDVFQDGEAPAPSSANAGVTAELDRICLRAIAVRPQDRYQSAEQLLDDLLGLPGTLSMHDRKVAGYLSKHFNVEEERRQLTRAISEARVLLDDATTITPVEDSPTVIAAQPSAPLAIAPLPTEGARSSASAVGLGFLGGAAVAAVVALALWPHRRDLPAAAPVAVPSTAVAEAKAPAVAPAAPVEASPPPVLGAAPELAAPTAETPAGSRTERRAVRVAPRRQPAPALAAAPVAGDLLRDAARLFKAGAFDRAFAAARAAAQAGGGAPAHLIMGKVYFAKSDLPNAESEFRQVVALRPDDAEAARFLDVIRKQAHRGP